ncbi:MAG: MarR family winged helix-turn-helix transcriptional regulator [Rhizobiaceae bacterium]
MPAYRALFARFDLTEQQWRVMRVLWSSQPVTSAELSVRTLLPAPSLVGIIDRLERKGLVSRLRSTSDRRVVDIVTTREGQKLETKVTPLVAQIDQELRSSVTPQEWASMEKTLQKITNQMTGLPGAEKSTHLAK